MKDRVLELKAAGRNHSQIAAMLMIHKQEVDAIINGDISVEPKPKKKAVKTADEIKISKLSEDDGTI